MSVEENKDSDTLYDLFSKTMENQGGKPGYPRAVLKKLCDAIFERECGTLLTGIDERGDAHCSLLLVWDSKYAYYLSGGTDPDLRSSGAMPLTMWHAIKTGSKYADNFDFEGSMQKGIDKFVLDAEKIAKA